MRAPTTFPKLLARSMLDDHGRHPDCSIQKAGQQATPPPLWKALHWPGTSAVTRVELVRALLEAGPWLCGVAFALREAVLAGSGLDVIQLLLEWCGGATSLDAQEEALVLAAGAGHLEVVRTVLEFGLAHLFPPSSSFSSFRSARGGGGGNGGCRSPSVNGWKASSATWTQPHPW